MDNSNSNPTDPNNLNPTVAPSSTPAIGNINQVDSVALPPQPSNPFISTPNPLSSMQSNTMPNIQTPLTPPIDTNTINTPLDQPSIAPSTAPLSNTNTPVDSSYLNFNPPTSPLTVSSPTTQAPNPINPVSPTSFPFGSVFNQQTTPPQNSTLPSIEQTNTTPEVSTSPVSVPPSPETNSPQPIQPIAMDASVVQEALSSSPNTQPIDNAPTDLSHLIDQSVNSNSSSVYAPTLSQQPETLVVPNGENPTVTENNTSKPVPKWLIGVAVGLLIIVAAASAYFIIGIGQTAPEAASIPAVQTNEPQLQAPPAAVPQIPTPSLSPATEATNSGSSFGDLGNTDSQATPAASTRPSATELLRQRQGR